MHIASVIVALAAVISLGFTLTSNITLREQVDRRTTLLAETAEYLVEMQKVNDQNLLTIQANYNTIQEMYRAEPRVYCISHFPFEGNPWILEVWWKEKLLWIPLVAYHSRVAAEDVKTQLERGELEERFLVR